ncbi:MAG: hypothetical protein ABIE23_05075 [archaeon]
MDKVAELRPFQKRVELLVKVVEKTEEREVTSRLDNTTHRVSEAVVGDETGTILLTLWDDLIDKIEQDKVYKVTNGYTSLFKNTLRLNIGRYGTIEDSSEEIGEVNSDNNVSEKEIQTGGRFGGERGGGFRRGFEKREKPKREETEEEDTSDEDKEDDEESDDDSEDEPEADTEEDTASEKSSGAKDKKNKKKEAAEETSDEDKEEDEESDDDSEDEPEADTEEDEELK